MAGRLTVVGTGIRAGVQLTDEAREALERADAVFFLSADDLGAAAVLAVAPDATSLGGLYEPGEGRERIYAAMVEAMLAPVRQGLDVCAAFYGHPGIYGTPGHAVVRRARGEGYEATLLPGISALDCLVADLGVDPGATGLQSYEATYFVEHRPPVDPRAVLVLWQPGVLGRRDAASAPDRARLRELAGLLGSVYGPEQEAIVYVASPYPVAGPSVERLAVADLPSATLPAMATLVVLPAGQPAEAFAEARASSSRVARAATTLPFAE